MKKALQRGELSNKIRHLHSEGMRNCDIARELGARPDTIAKTLRRMRECGKQLEPSKKALILNLKKQGLNNAVIAKKVGCSERYVYMILDKNPELKSMPVNNKSRIILAAKHFEDPDTGRITMLDETVKERYTGFRPYSTDMLKKANTTGLDPTDFLRLHKLSDDWIILNMWHKEKEDPDAVPYSSLLVRPKKKGEFSYTDLLNVWKRTIKPIKFNTTKAAPSGHTFIINLADLHFGLAEWKKQEPVIAETLANIKGVFEYAKKAGVKNKRIIINFLGDIFHSSKLDNSVTNSGTQLSPSSLFDGIDMFQSFMKEISAITLEACSNVELYSARGNHDDTPAYAFMKGWEMNATQIKSRISKAYRDYFRVGKTVFMVTHGHGIKKNTNFQNVFISEYFRANPEELKDIHELKFEVISAHTHHETTVEKDGVFHRSVGTKKPTDDYEEINYYIGARKEWKIVEYDDEKHIRTHVI